MRGLFVWKRDLENVVGAMHEKVATNLPVGNSLPFALTVSQSPLDPDLIVVLVWLLN